MLLGRAMLLGAAIVAVLATSGQATTSMILVASSCTATRVHHEPIPFVRGLTGSSWIAGTPARMRLFGWLFGGEVVDGRFAVFAGGTNPTNRVDEKILWIVPLSKRVGPRLAISGRLNGSSRITYRRRYAEASSEQTPAHLFPSVLDLPRAGCWKLTLTSGPIKAMVTVFAQQPPPPPS